MISAPCEIFSGHSLDCEWRQQSFSQTLLSCLVSELLTFLLSGPSLHCLVSPSIISPFQERTWQGSSLIHKYSSLCLVAFQLLTLPTYRLPIGLATFQRMHPNINKKTNSALSKSDRLLHGCPRIFHGFHKSGDEITLWSFINWSTEMKFKLE